jgi:putative transcription factor
MPVVPVESGQDWAPVNAGAGGLGGPSKVPVNAQQLRLAKAAGLVATEKRHGAGSNSSAHSGATVMSARKLDEATDAGTLVRVDKDLSKAIQQARMAKKMTQKDLATAINEKPQVVGEYESGKAIPNPAIILKLERKLGVKLPRPGKSKVAASGNNGGPVVSAAAKQAAAVTRGGPPKRR